MSAKTVESSGGGIPQKISAPPVAPNPMAPSSAFTGKDQGNNNVGQAQGGASPVNVPPGSNKMGVPS